MADHTLDPGATAVAVLAAASRIVDGVQEGVRRRGFTDVRPAHGFAFARISAGGATMLDVAAHLGVTKQAASQMVRQLVELGYVEQRTDPADHRRRELALTPRGRACTAAADAALRETVQGWEPVLGAAGLRQLGRLLGRLDLEGPLRPAW